MNGRDTLYNALLADSALVAIVGDKIATGPKDPKDWGPNDPTVTVYSSGVRDHSLAYLDNTLTVNCRASSETAALQIAGAVVSAVNRVRASGRGRFYCSTSGTIKPIDSTDSYNVPVEVIIKGQTALA